MTLYAEFLPTQQRAKCVVLIESFWAIGAAFEALLAYLVMATWGWRVLVLLSSLPLGLFGILSFVSDFFAWKIPTNSVCEMLAVVNRYEHLKFFKNLKKC